MEWQGFKANTSDGINFIQGMISIDRRWEASRELFMKFCNEQGFSAWHIHDGWVKDGYRSGPDLHKNKDIRLVWISEHSGYSHSQFPPKHGDKIVLIKDSPDVDNTSPFSLFVYDCADTDDGFLFQEFALTLIEIRTCFFDRNSNSYQLKIRQPIIPMRIKERLLKIMGRL